MEKARKETNEGRRSQPNWQKFVISVGRKNKWRNDIVFHSEALSPSITRLDWI